MSAVWEAHLLKRYLVSKLCFAQICIFHAIIVEPVKTIHRKMSPWLILFSLFFKVFMRIIITQFNGNLIKNSFWHFRLKKIYIHTNYYKNLKFSKNIIEQAGAELCQAQFKLGLTNNLARCLAILLSGGRRTSILMEGMFGYARLCIFESKFATMFDMPS